MSLAEQQRQGEVLFPLCTPGCGLLAMAASPWVVAGNRLRAHCDSPNQAGGEKRKKQSISQPCIDCAWRYFRPSPFPGLKVTVSFRESALCTLTKRWHGPSAEHPLEWDDHAAKSSPMLESRSLIHSETHCLAKIGNKGLMVRRGGTLVFGIGFKTWRSNLHRR